MNVTTPVKKLNSVDDNSLLAKISLAIIVCIALGVSPFLSMSFSLGFHNKQRILEALCVTMAVVFTTSAVRSGKKSGISVSSHTANCLVIFFLIGIFSSLNSYSPRHAFFEWANFLLLTVLALNIAIEVHANTADLLNRILNLVGIACIFYLLNVVLVYAAFLAVGGHPNPTEFIPGFDNHRFFNHIQTISLPMLVLLIMRSERFGKQYWLWFVCTSAWWALLFVAAGRGTFIGLVGATVITWLFRRRFALAWTRTMIYTCFAGLVIYLLFFSLLPLWLGQESFGLMSGVVKRTLDNPSSNRTLLWRLAWAMISEHPWLGAGPLHFAHFGPAAGNGAHPHNWVLQIAAEWGIPATIFLMIAIGLAYSSLAGTGKTIAPGDEKNQMILCAWLTTGAAILIDGLVSGLLVMPTSELWIALYVGCAWGWTSSVGRRSSSAEGFRKNIVKRQTEIMLVSLFAIYLLWRGLFPEILNLGELEAEAVQSPLYPHGILRPRIWRAGYF